MKLFAKDIPPGSKEFSALAIIETFCACALALWLAFRHGWMGWLADSICIAPLLLLRTKYSQTLALLWFEKVSKYAVKKGASLRLTVLFIWLLIILVVVVLGVLFAPEIDWDLIWKIALGVFMLFLGLQVFFNLLSPLPAIPLRMAATIAALFKKRRESIEAIPRNWILNIAAIDSTVTPEILPGINQFLRSRPLEFTPENLWIMHPNFWQPRKVLSILRSFEGIFFGIIFIPFALAVSALPILVGFAYRWALKSTAVVWLPLVVLVDGVYRKAYTLSWLVRDILTTPLWCLLRVYGAVVIVFNGILPLALFSTYYRTSAWLVEVLQVPPTIASYYFIGQGEVYSWHVAGVLAALSTWIAYIWAGSVKSAIDEHQLADEKKQKHKLRLLQGLLATRAILSSYTIVCGVIAFAKTQDWRWVQAITFRWFP